MKKQLRLVNRPFLYLITEVKESAAGIFNHFLTCEIGFVLI